MHIDLDEWGKLILRWIHVFSAFLWIGQTYLFNFFERQIRRGEGAGEKPNVAGSLWLVHGGGFYLVEKQLVPELMPKTLHWFKWEAFSTWFSGLGLIIWTYYFGGLLVEAGQSFPRAVVAGLAVLVLGWIVYDLMVRSPLGKNEPLFALIGLIGLMAMEHGLRHVMSARAAFIHVGAVIGTIMTSNVWMRILPAQRKMIAARREGRVPDPSLSASGPTRSKHNTYLVIPLVFLMISNHYPTISYGSRHWYLVMPIVFLAGWAMAKTMRDGWQGS